MSERAAEVVVKVCYFGLIRDAAETGEETVALPAGSTVRQLVAALVARHGEGFGEALFWPDGEPLPFVNLLLGGRDIQHLGGLDTLIEADSAAQIVLMPAAMGGG